jgi:hypothetical protein
MRTIQIRIEGITPLLVHRFGEQAEQARRTRRIEATEVDPRAEATRHAYIADDGTFYFSAFAIPNSMGAAGASHKARGTRKTLRFVVPSAVRVTTDRITIMNGNGSPAPDFEVDSRPVTIPATKGRIMRHRPRWDKWSAEFDLVVNDELLDPATAHVLLAEAGLSIGIGDFRPEKRGPFGTFRVTRWEMLDGASE